jgi:hypothetical protein
MPPGRKKAKSEEDAVPGESVIESPPLPIRRIHNLNDAIVVNSQLSLFVNVPTNTLLSVVVGVAARLQDAVAPLRAPIHSDDRQSSVIKRDHLRVLASAHLQLTQALNELLAVEAALLLRTAEVHVA